VELPGEGQPPVGRVDRMVGSRQPLPEQLSWVRVRAQTFTGSRPLDVGLFRDVAPHEYIPGTE